MSNTEEKTNEMDETIEKVIVEEESDQLLKNESSKETDNRWNKFLIESNALVRGSLYEIAKQGLKFIK